jgi:hypothetical protein
MLLIDRHSKVPLRMQTKQTTKEKAAKKGSKPLAAKGPAKGKAAQKTQRTGLTKAVVSDKTPAPAAPRIVKVTFVFPDLGAKQVSVCGDFNAWATDAAPMKRDHAGHWETTLALAPGRYEYKFVVDGEWVPDPLAREQVWNHHCTLNSVIEVRA